MSSWSTSESTCSLRARHRPKMHQEMDRPLLSSSLWGWWEEESCPHNISKAFTLVCASQEDKEDYFACDYIQLDFPFIIQNKKKYVRSDLLWGEKCTINLSICYTFPPNISALLYIPLFLTLKGNNLLNNNHILSSDYLPDTVLKALHILSNLTFKIASW